MSRRIILWVNYCGHTAFQNTVYAEDYARSESTAEPMADSVCYPSVEEND